MGIGPKTIFSNSSFRPTETTETKKVGFWLEKLFHQRKDKEKRILREQERAQAGAIHQVFSDIPEV